MIPGYVGERSVPYCSPIYVTKVEPLKTGQGKIRIEFINVFYAAGAQGFGMNMTVLKRAKDYLIAEIDPNDRSAVISHIEFEWVKRFCPELWYNKPPSSVTSTGSISLYLDEVFFSNDGR